MNSNNTKKKIYLDHSATTPVAPEVLGAMMPYFTGQFGNASSVHSFGQDAKVALEEARRQIAAGLNAEPSETVFTSGGTEADNWAIKGATYFFRGQKNHIVTSAIEHHAVLYTCKYLEKNGFDVTYVPVNQFGMVESEKVAEAIRDDTCLVSIMHGNNEVGTINPIREIGAVAKERGVLFHTDAVQTFGKVPIDVNEMNIDLLSISGHKIYGPKGIGALYMRRGLQIEKFMHGGHHERDRRAGTENIPGAVGLGKAAEICFQRMAADSEKLSSFDRELYQKTLARIENVHLNGHEEHRVPGILNLSFEGVQSDSLLLSLDLQGIAVSNGSACSSGTIEPSHVLKAMKLPATLTNSALRFSLGRDNTSEEIEATAGALEEIVSRLRALKKPRKILESETV